MEQKKFCAMFARILRTAKTATKANRAQNIKRQVCERERDRDREEKKGSSN